jgi:hypothetical protein
MFVLPCNDMLVFTFILETPLAAARSSHYILKNTYIYIYIKKYMYIYIYYNYIYVITINMYVYIYNYTYIK